MKKLTWIVLPLLSAPLAAFAQKAVSESFKLDDPKVVQEVKAGDKVDITYTAADMITVQ